MKNKNNKGFTLIELITVIAIIGILATILVPSIVNYVRKAKLKAAIGDTKVIRSCAESALVEHLTLSFANTEGAFNKILYVNQNKTKYESVGCFTNYTWYRYKKNDLNDSDNPSQVIDKVVAGALDGEFTEVWETGKKVNPLGNNRATKNCAMYLDTNNTNFGLVIVYNTLGCVLMIQCYRKGVLVTYINGEYVTNDDPNAAFIGTRTWDNIYKDAGLESPDKYKTMSLSNRQFKNGSSGATNNWYS